MGAPPDCQDGGDSVQENRDVVGKGISGKDCTDDRGHVNADLQYEQIGDLDGGYYDGDEPEEDDSQAEMDD